MGDTRGSVDDQQAHQLVEKGKQTHISQNLRVLALDDSVICLAVLSSQLRKCGYQVTATTKALEALELLRKNSNEYDIVITDVIRSDIPGFKLLEIIRKEWDIPVIIISANDDRRLVEQGVRYGARDYLVKPVRIEILHNIWQHVVRKVAVESQADVNSNQVACPDPQPEVTDAVDSQADVNSNPNQQLVGENIEDVSDAGQSTGESAPYQRKRRVIWGPSLHQKFLAVVKQLDVDNAVPKKILERMNEPGLTRENVASHLQKYRNSLRKTRQQLEEEVTRSTPADGTMQFYNPALHAAMLGKRGLILDHNSYVGRRVMDNFSNHSLVALNYNDNLIFQRRRLLSENVQPNWINMTTPVPQNLAPTLVPQNLAPTLVPQNLAPTLVPQNLAPNTTTLTADILGSSSRKYQIPQNQRTTVDQNYGQISSQLPAGVWQRSPELFPNLMIDNSGGSLSTALVSNIRPYSNSPVSINAAVAQQVGYLQPNIQPFQANSSVTGNSYPAQPFSAANSAQHFLAASSIGENNGRLLLPLPDVGSVHNNGSHALIFPKGSSVGVNNSGTHLAPTLPVADGFVQQNNARHAPASRIGSTSTVESNNSTHLALPFPPFPTSTSVRENNIGNHAHAFQAADSSLRAQTNIAGTSVGENINGYVAHPSQASNIVSKDNNDHAAQSVPVDPCAKGKNTIDMEEVKDCPDDELTFMVKQFTNYNAPSMR